MVLKGEPLKYFLKTEAIDSKNINEKGEFITWLNTADGRFTEFMGFISYSNPIDELHSYRYYGVSRNYGEVYLHSTTGNRYEGERGKATWQFHDCK